MVSRNCIGREDETLGASTKTEVWQVDFDRLCTW